MSRAPKDMERLMRVTEAAFDAKRLQMARIIRQEEAIRTQIAELTAPRPVDDTPIEENAAARAGAALLYEQWLDRRITTLNREMAKLRVAKARLHGPLSKAFGKYQVTGHLFERSRLDLLAKINLKEEDGR